MSYHFFQISARFESSLLRGQRAWLAGDIDTMELQRRWDAARAILLPADDPAWRRCRVARGLVHDA